MFAPGSTRAGANRFRMMIGVVYTSAGCGEAKQRGLRARPYPRAPGPCSKPPLHSQGWELIETLDELMAEVRGATESRTGGAETWNRAFPTRGGASLPRDNG